MIRLIRISSRDLVTLQPFSFRASKQAVFFNPSFGLLEDFFFFLFLKENSGKQEVRSSEKFPSPLNFSTSSGRKRYEIPSKSTVPDPSVSISAIMPSI